jgi:hypothetical protein
MTRGQLLSIGHFFISVRSCHRLLFSHIMSVSHTYTSFQDGNREEKEGGGVEVQLELETIDENRRRGSQKGKKKKKKPFV